MLRPRGDASRVAAIPLVLAGITTVVVAASASAQQSSPASSDAIVSGRFADAPTYYADVLPIVQRECASCHRSNGADMGGMVAPFSVLSFEEARPWAPMMAESVATGRMPPWSAAEAHRGSFANERWLEEAEKATIVAWAEGGSPAGDPDEAPPLPEALAEAMSSDSEWALGEPDLVLSFAAPYCLDDDLEDLYVDIPVQITEEMLPADRWIQSVEYRNGPAVHHILSSAGGLAPGMEPNVYEDGYGRLFRAGPREVMFNQ